MDHCSIFNQEKLTTPFFRVEALLGSPVGVHKNNLVCRALPDRPCTVILLINCQGWADHVVLMNQAVSVGIQKFFKYKK